MKTRNGFVSNSSSSSFVFLGFPKSSIEVKDVNVKDQITTNISKRDLDAFAFKEIRDDDEYEAYQSGNAPESFWKKAYDHFKGDLGYYDAPEGYEQREITTYTNRGYSSESWVGINLARVGDSGIKEIKEEDIAKARSKISTDFPSVSPRIILGVTEG